MQAPKKQSTTKFETVKAGLYPARCYQVIDLGTQVYNNKEGRKLYIAWEFPTQKMQDGRPYMISSWFTLSMFKNARLRQLVEGWLGKKLNDREADDFDLSTLIGKSCTINVAYSVGPNGTRANVQSVSPLMDGLTIPDAFNPPVLFSFDKPDDGSLERLSKGLREIIKRSTEYPRWKEAYALKIKDPEVEQYMEPNTKLAF